MGQLAELGHVIRFNDIGGRTLSFWVESVDGGVNVLLEVEECLVDRLSLAMECLLNGLRLVEECLVDELN